MRHQSLLVLPFALAAGATRNEWADPKYSWSYKPDRTALWYERVGRPLPETAPALSVEEREWSTSNIVKLECLGCPFRVRSLHQVSETWQEPPQDNSLMLNFTITKSEPALLLNGQPILPLGARPPAPGAFQIPANTSKEIMGKMVSQHMLDSETWHLGTKYGHFELQYEHALLATKQPDEEWIQFDVTGIHMRTGGFPRSYALNREGQKMVQVLLRREIIENKQTISFKDVQIVDRKDRAQPIKMRCGRDAIIRTEYNPLEWDGYGKLGTWSRTMHQIIGDSADFFESNMLLLAIVSVVLGIYSLVRWYLRCAKKRAAATQVKDDAEAALLGVEYNDAPPEYAEVPAVSAQKEDDQ